MKNSLFFLYIIIEVKQNKEKVTEQVHKSGIKANYQENQNFNMKTLKNNKIHDKNILQG